MELKHKFGRTAVSPVVVSSPTSDQSSADNSAINSTNLDALLLNEVTWQFSSSVKVPSIVFDSTSIEYQQDNYEADSIITNFTYQFGEVLNAVFVSNGVTHVSVYNRNGDLLPEFSRVKYIQKKKSKLKLSPERHIEGVSANLYGNVENTAGNYGHWLIDGISRLFLILRNYPIDSIDWFLVPKLKYDFQLESLVACGVPPEKIIQIDTLECISLDSLLCATPPRDKSSGVCPAWVIDNFRDQTQLAVTNNLKPKRLYISRRDANSRNFTNENDLIELLERYGFEAVELSKYNYAGKIELFSNAECVIGLTGAGLTNLIFSPVGASVLELMPHSNVNYLYTSICGYLGLNYASIIFKTGDLLSKVNKYQGNLFLDPAILESELKTLLEQADSTAELPK